MAGEKKEPIERNIKEAEKRDVNQQKKKGKGGGYPVWGGGGSPGR